MENFEVKQESDSVAEFLNREEKQLAELNDIGDLTKGTVAESTEMQGMDDDDARFDRYDALKEDGPPRIETDKIRKWQEEQRQRLEAKDAESEKRQKEWLKVAILELDDYKKHREEQLGKTKKSNRQGEEIFIRERDEKTPGGEWERVCRLCDFNPKTSVRPAKDISRLRSLLLQLKQTPNASFVVA